VDLLTPVGATTLVLLVTRVSGVVLVAPLFSSQAIPVRVRTVLVVLFSWLLHPLALTWAQSPRLTPGQVLSEALVGFAVGLGAAVLVGAAEAMGDLLAIQIGLSGAASMDPLTFTNIPVLGTFANLFAITLLLSMDAHLVMVQGLAGTFQAVPVGSPVDVQAGMAAMVGLGSVLFRFGVQLAAPVIAAVMLANVALAVLNRAAPQIQILAVAFPLQIGVGLMALGASIPLIATFFTGFTGMYESMLRGLLDAFVGGGR
jgi:flagellar biosynthesis protein FliR